MISVISARLDDWFTLFLPYSEAVLTYLSQRVINRNRSHECFRLYLADNEIRYVQARARSNPPLHHRRLRRKVPFFKSVRVLSSGHEARRCVIHRRCCGAARRWDDRRCAAAEEDSTARVSYLEQTSS